MSPSPSPPPHAREFATRLTPMDTNSRDTIILMLHLLQQVNTECGGGVGQCCTQVWGRPGLRRSSAAFCIDRDAACKRSNGIPRISCPELHVREEGAIEARKGGEPATEATTAEAQVSHAIGSQRGACQCMEGTTAACGGLRGTGHRHDRTSERGQHWVVRSQLVPLL